MSTVSEHQPNSPVDPKPKHNYHVARYRQVAMVMSKYKLRNLMQTLGMEHVIPFWWIPPGNPWRKQVYPQSVRTRMALEELGTTFVKLGQILSTRTDMIPIDYVRELAKLQDSLKPLPLELITGVIKRELGRPVEEVFASFDPVPLGVASIGQAHAATLHDGSEVVIKVRKPGVKEQVEEDIQILRQMAASAARRWKDARHYDLIGVVEEVTEAMMLEMDYIREGHNAEYFASFFKKDTTIHVPKVYWDYTTSQVITLERIKGINIQDKPALEKAGFNFHDLANRSVYLWQQMVFNGDLFHADPHPGNLFVEKGGRLGLIDFGMVGIVDTEVQEHLADAVKAILDRDVDLLIDSLIELGAVRIEISRQDLRTDLRHIMGHYPKLSISEIQYNFNLGELITVIRRHQVKLPSNTFLLLKTMAMAQSLGKGLNPDFDILQLLEPDVVKVLSKKHSLLAIAQQLPAAGINLASLSIGLPQRINRILRTFERGEARVRTDVSGLELHMEHLERIVNRVVLGIMAASIILVIAILILAFRLGN